MKKIKLLLSLVAIIMLSVWASSAQRNCIVDEKIMEDKWLKYPLVVKPVDGWHWIGITTNIKDFGEEENAIKIVKKSIEEYAGMICE